ncbi:MAG TPA: signal peptide peptidase SppA [Niabella sp.]|jgi:protease-4|nr:signal peptide peptidase SppA [Chitinophagaceae bacterium]HRN47907.1 signal peptide peptidase SppA [Niabella sp.]HRO83372.1 signal peptide peptidase SppA [Niabella sp.]HUN02108.1 signal peptide peptidase SppA [Niabella sp.]
MKSFFKTFFAALLAFFVFWLIVFFFFMGIAASTFSKQAPLIPEKSVLTINLENRYDEIPKSDYQSMLKSKSIDEPPGLYDVIRLIKKAKDDKKISGILLEAGENSNGFAASDEIREALKDFKTSGKFIIAYSDAMSQRAYSIANIANKVYVSPKGFFEWVGYSVNYTFIKGTLDKLEIKPQIFYAGKFKSATEPLRADKMTDANRLQTSEWLNDIYNDLLMKTSESRKVDTATLHNLANTGAIDTPEDAVTHKLIDGVKYDDELKDELKKNLSVGAKDKISFVSIEKYASANTNLSGSGEKIALIYAQGNIIDGRGDDDNIGGTTYINLIRKARLDESIKAIVLRVNSGGGSALASENINREISLAKKVKPVMVSFGDVAASGGYYISCSADSIFAGSNSITGSIGVFGVVPDMSSFFKNKLGVTFDGVKTGPLANAGNIDHPMNDQEKKIVQSSIERIYSQFKERVADGRKKDTAYIETIAQGRVWTGLKAKEIGLIDAFGGLQTAINAAASKAKLKEFEVVEFPEKQTLLEKILSMGTGDTVAAKIKADMGEAYYLVYKQLTVVRQLTQGAQARLPFDFFIK